MLPVSPVMDRVYFKSIYTRDLDGHIVELATMGPGFPVDEPVAELGQNLKLPSWLESNRACSQANQRSRMACAASYLIETRKCHSGRILFVSSTHLELQKDSI